MPLPTDFIDGDVLSASDVNDITTAVNAIDLSPLESDISTLQGDVTTLEGDVTNLETAVNAIDLSPLESDISTLQGDVTDLETAVGLLTNLSLNEKTANHTLVLGDATKAIEMNVASANTLTVPDNATVAFPVGTQIIVIQTGAGATTLAGAVGVTVDSKDGNLDLGGQYAGVTLIKRGTNTWVAVGDLA